MAQKNHDFTRTEILAGLLVLASLLTLAGFVAVIAGWSVTVESREYYARFSSTIGLDVGAEVRFGGLKAGRVTEIIPDPEDHSLIRVTAEMGPEFPVNEASVATIEQISLTAARHLEISTGTAEANLSEDGAIIDSVTKTAGLIEMPDLSGVIDGSTDLLSDLRDFVGVEEAKAVAEAEGVEMASVMRIAADLRSFLGVAEVLDGAAAGEAELTTVVSLADDVALLLGADAAAARAAEQGEEVESLATLMEEINGLVGGLRPDLDDNLEKLKGLQDEATGLLRELHETAKSSREPIEGILEDVAALVDSLKKEMDVLLTGLRDTLGNSERLTGEAASLVEDNRADIEDMISDLGGMIRHLNELTKTLKEHPDAIIRGKKREGRR